MQRISTTAFAIALTAFTVAASLALLAAALVMASYFLSSPASIVLPAL